MKHYYISTEIDETMPNYDFVLKAENQDMADEEYMTLAEQQGTVYSLKGFQDAFNYTDTINENYYIRIIKN